MIGDGGNYVIENNRVNLEIKRPSSLSSPYSNMSYYSLLYQIWFLQGLFV